MARLKDVRLLDSRRVIFFWIMFSQLMLVHQNNAVYGAELYPNQDHENFGFTSDGTISAWKNGLMVFFRPWGSTLQAIGIGYCQTCNIGPFTLLHTLNSSVLQQFSDDINIMYKNAAINEAYISTWSIPISNGKRNDFQTILAFDHSKSRQLYIIYNFNKIEWLSSQFITNAVILHYGNENQRSIKHPCLDFDSDLLPQVTAKSNIGIPGRYVIMHEDDDVFTLCYDLPTKPPKISVSNIEIVNGSSVTKGTGAKIDVSCTVEGGNPDAIVVSLTCGSESNDMDGTQSSLTLQLDMEWNQKMCTCQADHETYQYDLVSVFTLNVQYPPTGPPKIWFNNEVIANEASIAIATGEQMDLSCTVEGGNPEVTNVVLACGSVRNDTDGTQSSLTLQIGLEWNQSACTCGANHEIYQYEFYVSTFMIVVQYPPTDQPKMIVNNKEIVNGSSESKTKGEQIDVSCTVEGGNPEVTKVLLTCGSESNDMHGTQSSLTILLDMEWNQKMCSCRADHETNQYVLVSVFTLDVHYPPTDPPKMIVNNKEIVNGGSESKTTGEQIDVSCTVEGGNPEVNTVLLTCGSESNDMDGTQSSLTLQLDKEWNQETCTCRADHETTQYDLTSVFTLDVQYQPTDPPKMIVNNKEIVNGSSESKTTGEQIEVSCTVEGGNPEVKKVLLACGIESNDMDGTQSSLTILLDMEWNQKMCSCRADRETNQYDLVSVFTLDVHYPPTDPTNMIVNNKEIVNGSSESKTTGEQIDVSCTVEGGNPEVTKVLLTCGSESNDMDGTQSSLTLQLDKEWNQEICTCRADHETTQYDLTSVFTLDVHYPPTDPPKMIVNNKEIVNGSSESKETGEQIDVSCTVEGGNPGVNNVLLACGSESNDMDGAQSSLTLQLDKEWNQEICTCQADHETTQYDLTSVFTLDVHYPPTGPPKINVSNTEIVNGSSESKSTGEHIDVSCTVEGGNPEVTKVLLTCGSERNDMDGTQSSLTLQLDKEWNQKICTCRADHETNQYNLVSVFTLDVHYPPNKAPEMSVINTNKTNNNNLPITNVTVKTIAGDDLEVRCVVGGGNPEVLRVVIVCGEEKNETVGTEASLTLDIDESWHHRACSCNADHVTGQYDLISIIRFDVKYPPVHRPELRVNNGDILPNGTSVTENLGDLVNVTCVAEGGNPGVTYVLLECGNATKQSMATTTSMTLELSRHWHQEMCVCRADHVTGDYNMVSTFTFTLKGKSNSSMMSKRNIAIFMSIIVGGLAVDLGGVVCICMSKTVKGKY